MSVAEDVPAPEIVVRHGSRMANRMLQLLAATALAEAVPGARVTGYDIPEWGLMGPAPGPRLGPVPRVKYQRFDPVRLAGLMRSGRLPRVVLRNPCANLPALPDRTTAARLFNADGVTHTRTGDDEIVFHIRLEDILAPGRHPDYGPLPLGYYADIVDQTGKRPVFIGQLGDDFFSAALRARFPQARFLEGGSVLHDFQTLRFAPHLGLAVSTFSWMAGWLGAAQTIHYPLSGILNPLQEPGIDLLPLDDTRYRFYGFEPTRWQASDAEKQALIDGGAARPLSPGQVRQIHARAARREADRTAAWHADFEAGLPAAPA